MRGQSVLYAIPCEIRPRAVCEAISQGILFSMSSTGSFLKFTVGFLTFISVSFIVSFAVNTYEVSKSAEEQTAAAIETMLESKK